MSEAINISKEKQIEGLENELNMLSYMRSLMERGQYQSGEDLKMRYISYNALTQRLNDTQNQLNALLTPPAPSNLEIKENI